MIKRSGTRALIGWMPVAHATKYAVGVTLGNGRKLSLATTRSMVTVTKLTTTDSIKTTVGPVMPNGVIGKPATTSLKTGAKSVSRRQSRRRSASQGQVIPARVWRPRGSAQRALRPEHV